MGDAALMRRKASAANKCFPKASGQHYKCFSHMAVGIDLYQRADRIFLIVPDLVPAGRYRIGIHQPLCTVNQDRPVPQLKWNAAAHQRPLLISDGILEAIQRDDNRNLGPV